jgi:hypothetical protein
MTKLQTYSWGETLRQGFDPLMVTWAINGGVQGKHTVSLLDLVSVFPLPQPLPEDRDRLYILNKST